MAHCNQTDCIGCFGVECQSVMNGQCYTLSGAYCGDCHDCFDEDITTNNRNQHNGTQSNLRTRQGQFINRRTGQPVPPNMPYHSHEGQAMAGARHVSTPHDNYDRVQPDSGRRLSPGQRDCNPGEVELWGVCYDPATTTHIHRMGEGLVGPIPQDIQFLHNLQALTLGSNDISGQIPSSIGNLPNLQFLNLSYNELTGPIPSSIGNLTNLISLSLFGNQLSGEIPSSIGNLTNLNSLSLWENQLTGEIPPEICNIDYSSVRNNKLCFPYPSCISQFDIDSQDTSNCSPLLGDVNQDGQIDIVDVVRIVNHIAGTVGLNYIQQQLADINQDGNINITDIVATIQQILSQGNLTSQQRHELQNILRQAQSGNLRGMRHGRNVRRTRTSSQRSQRRTRTGGRTRTRMQRRGGDTIMPPTNPPRPRPRPLPPTQVPRPRPPIYGGFDCNCPTGTEYIGGYPVFHYNGICCNTVDDCCFPEDYGYLGDEGFTCIQAMTTIHPDSGLSMMEHYNDDIDCSQSDICCDVNNPANCHHCSCFANSGMECQSSGFTGGLSCCGEPSEGS